MDFIAHSIQHLSAEKGTWEQEKSLALAKCIWPSNDVQMECILKVHSKGSYLELGTIISTEKNDISNYGAMSRIPHKSLYNPHVTEIML